ncbi:unnamed protein product [Mucor hiemalis]
MVSTRSSSRTVKTEKNHKEQQLTTVVQRLDNAVTDVATVDDDDFQEPLTVVKPKNQRRNVGRGSTAKRRKTNIPDIKELSPSVVSEDTKDGWSCAATPESSSTSISIDSCGVQINNEEDEEEKISNLKDLEIMIDDTEKDELMDSDEGLDFSAAPAPSSPVPLTELRIENQSPLNEDGADEEEHSDTNSDEHSSSDGETPPPPTRRRRRPLTEAQRTTRGFSRRMQNYKRSQLRILEQHPELEHVWTDIEQMEEKPVVPIEQPAELTLKLLPFQRYGVGWMIQQEATATFRGGVLADEMGMGKTIQTIALLLSDKKKPNLVIAPTVAIMQWKSEIENHTNNKLSVHIFHGSSRINNAAELKKFDVVLSTYSVIETAFRRQEYGFKRTNDEGMPVLVKAQSTLHKMQWHRIILDEAHNVKDRSSNTARAVFNMNANFRWSLTGTPLQNRVGELYSLIRFMQADPFAYYYCKSCDCKELTWRFSNKKTCDTCHHRPMDHSCWWNNEVLKPIQMHGYVGDGKVAMSKLRLLLDKIMLRRTKVECADDLGLPPRTVLVRRDMFSEEEEDMYTSLYSDVSRAFTTYVAEGTVLNNYANIFELLTKMRQCADHPDLVTKKTTDNKQLVCMLCNDPPEDAVAASCKHVFCRECCEQYYKSFDDSIEGNAPRCPSCFAVFSVDLTQDGIEVDRGTGSSGNYSKSSIINRINMDKWRSSTKIEALVEELSKLRREDKTIKSIVFSQFVNFLDLINWRLSRAGYRCIRLDGSMSPLQRELAIQHFNTNPAVTVFLISLKAGGVALNLTEASRVFICDPWWNPAAELQAMDRIHRLGQYRPIRITRLVIENSIESRIIQLQEKKTALVESTVEKNATALEKLTVEDLRFLFVM